MSEFQLECSSKVIIGMIHVQALPGTPMHQYSIDEIIRQAVIEATVYEENGVDAIMLENMHDVPYLNRVVGPEITASMTAISIAVKKAVKLPVGIQLLAGANKEALAIAQAAQLDFIRAEGFVFAHLADEGWMNGCAGTLLRYRKQIGADHVRIITDIKKKHSSHAVTEDVSIEEHAKAAEFFLSDGVIVTGGSTGEAASVEELQKIANCTALPVLIGSGITADNIDEYWPLADAFIVGSYFKGEGNWKNPVDTQRVLQFMQNVKRLREQK